MRQKAPWIGLVLNIAAIASLTLSGGFPSAAAAPAGAAAAAYDWPQFNFDAQHTGNNGSERTLSPENVGGLRRLFQVSLPDAADGAPAYLSAASTPSGARDLLFVTTRAGHIAALDAHTGQQLWMHQYPAGPCRINNGFQPCYTTSSPAIDPNRSYVYSYGLDGYVHKYRVGDGVEITGGGWPEVTTLKPFDEKGSSALSVATARNGTSYLYVAHSGYLGDGGDYQGHLTTINLVDGSQHVFNTICSDQTVHFVEQPGTPDCPEVMSAIWARPGVVYSSDTDRIYMTTGNGTYNPAAHHWGDSVFALNPDGTGANGGPLDSYTPANYQELQARDADLGSTGPAILRAPAGSAVKHLALQGGKDGKLRLLNLDDLSGQGGPGYTEGQIGPIIGSPQGGVAFSFPAAWVNPADNTTWAFVAGSPGVAGLRLAVGANGIPSLRLMWQAAGGGTSPIIANGVLYVAGSNAIRALDPLTGKQLWHDTGIGAIHWESPVVANGVLYITDENGQLTAYAPNGVK